MLFYFSAKTVESITAACAGIVYSNVPLFFLRQLRQMWRYFRHRKSDIYTVSQKSKPRDVW